MTDAKVGEVEAEQVSDAPSLRGGRSSCEAEAESRRRSRRRVRRSRADQRSSECNETAEISARQAELEASRRR